ncbi:MAG: AAA family ATPase [Pseudomonadota bacterium]|nr:AAA family ATPase [Pseudomonadota bacterium]
MIKLNVVKDEVDFEAYARRALKGQYVRPASSFMDSARSFMTHAHTEGMTLPWIKTHDQFRFRKGEVTLWHGINGHGKSLLQGFVNLSLMQQGEKVCVASFEMKPARTLQRMMRQACGVANPTDAYMDRFENWISSRLWFYDKQGTVRGNTLIGVMAYCHEELGIQHFVIDSMMKCGIAPDDYARQKSFIDELTSMARDTGMHVHLVVHSRKGESEMERPGKMDVKGASEITDQVDNVLNIWRNKVKEQAVNNPSFKPKRGTREELLDAPDVLLDCDKQRNGEHEPKIALWFDRESFQYKAREHDRLIDFLGEGNE